MEFRVVRHFIFRKLSLKRKNQLHRFSILLKPSSVFFFVTAGAVKRTSIDVKHFRSITMQSRSRDIIEELENLILQVESKRFWPASRQLRFIDGMSGQSFRTLLNLLFATRKNSYLEIGTWKGSTFCSAIYRNTIEAVCVDNWSEFGGPAQVAIRNISKRVNESSSISIVARDFREMSFLGLLQKEIDVYFFDGPHSEKDHYDGARVINSLSFKSLLFIVDDWNWETVRQGTLRGLESLGINIVGQIEIFSDSSAYGRHSRWHNGYAFFVLER